MSDRLGRAITESTDWNGIQATVQMDDASGARGLADRLTTIEQLAASIAEVARQLQSMLAEPTVAVAHCAHPVEFQVVIPAMGDGPKSFLCRRCQTVIEQEAT